MKNPQTKATNGVVWNRLLRPDRGDLPPEAARFFLKLAFESSDLQRMHELTVKNQEGLLTPEEQSELADYRQVGFQLDLLRAKARLSLQPQGKS